MALSRGFSLLIESPRHSTLSMFTELSLARSGMHRCLQGPFAPPAWPRHSFCSQRLSLTCPGSPGTHIYICLVFFFLVSACIFTPSISSAYLYVKSPPLGVSPQSALMPMDSGLPRPHSKLSGLWRSPTRSSWTPPIPS